MGRALKETVLLFAQAALIVVVMIPFGFTLYPAGALAGLALLCLLGVGLGALSFALALVVHGQDWIFWTVQQTLVFPLTVLSGVFLPNRDRPEVDEDGVRGEPDHSHRRGGAAPLQAEGYRRGG